MYFVLHMPSYYPSPAWDIVCHCCGVFLYMQSCGSHDALIVAGKCLQYFLALLFSMDRISISSYCVVLECLILKFSVSVIDFS